LARVLNRPSKVFCLDSTTDVAAALAGAGLVLNCAGPVFQDRGCANAGVRWRKARRLGRPIGEKRGGHYQEARRGVRFASIKRHQQGQDLNGFAETHVVGKASAETELD
jgi:hypothetical protein